MSKRLQEKVIISLLQDDIVINLIELPNKLSKSIRNVGQEMDARWVWDGIQRDKCGARFFCKGYGECGIMLDEFFMQSTLQFNPNYDAKFS